MKADLTGFWEENSKLLLQGDNDWTDLPDMYGKSFGVQGLNSIEFQQDVQQDFQQIIGHSVRLNTLLKIMLNSLLKFN